MSQVKRDIRKFDEGGSNTPIQNKFGKYIKDGRAYDVDEDFFTQFAAHNSSLTGNERIVAGEIVKRLRSGQDVNVDSNNYTLDGSMPGTSRFTRQMSASRGEGAKK